MPWLIGVVALLVIAVCTALLVWLRLGDARLFGQAYKVRTYAGTNYVFQFIETTVGKVESGCVLIVSARIENPNPVTLTLQRDWFVLADHDKDYYQPVLTTGQTGTITIPANGVAEKEAFHFVVPDDTLTGLLALSVGHHYFAMFKSDKPMSRQLTKGQFVTVRQLNW
ncbi:MAG: hypothetical protein WCS70_03580 [Verrucomicrobiota bacterium]